MSAHWSIKLTVSGGWGGARVHHLESEKLSGETLAHAQTVVQTSGILAIAGHKQHGGGIADQQSYTFEVTVDGTTHTLHYSDLDLPPQIRRLVEFMEAADRH